MSETTWHSEVLELERQGRVWVRGALNESDLTILDSTCRMECAPGARLNLSDGLSDVIGAGSRLTERARKLLPGGIPVRVVVFNKSSDVNWQVPWHQDRVIAVQDKHAVDGFELWTKKAGIWHVQPPIDLLQNMIFACVYLDDADERNGCLELALGSHVKGLVKVEDAPKVAASSTIELCHARRGDILFVKALTLHRSRPSKKHADRRTLRVDFCAMHLPGPLVWAL